MSKEELLAMLQEKGLSDDDIKALLEEVLGTLGKDFEEHDEKEEAAAEDEEEKKAAELLGVDL